VCHGGGGGGGRWAFTSMYEQGVSKTSAHRSSCRKDENEDEEEQADVGQAWQSIAARKQNVLRFNGIWGVWIRVWV